MGRMRPSHRLHFDDDEVGLDEVDDYYDAMEDQAPDYDPEDDR